MYHRLALAFGKPVKRFLEEIDGRELTEWAAYFDQEPPADIKEDIRWAHWMAMYANAHRSENTGEYEPSDFLDALPWWNRPDEANEPDLDKLVTKIQGIHSALSGS